MDSQGHNAPGKESTQTEPQIKHNLKPQGENKGFKKLEPQAIKNLKAHLKAFQERRALDKDFKEKVRKMSPAEKQQSKSYAIQLLEQAIMVQYDNSANGAEFDELAQRTGLECREVGADGTLVSKKTTNDGNSKTDLDSGSNHASGSDAHSLKVAEEKEEERRKVYQAMGELRGILIKRLEVLEPHKSWSESMKFWRGIDGWPSSMIETV